MKKIYIILLTILSSHLLIAQVEQGGIPYSTLHNLPEVSNLVSFPEVNLNQLASEDAIYDLQKDVPYRFGFNFDVNYNVNNSGEWIQLQNGDRLWRASFYSENAQTLNFLLENFNLAPGASIFFYNEDKSVVIGSFTEKNNREHHNLSTMPLRGEKITIEFFEPAGVKNISTFNITRVTHGYRSLRVPTKGVNDAGTCNNNVICGVGDNWRDQIRSVGIIIVNGNGSCTGAMVNNTCVDRKPYFLTAEHCLGGNVTTWNIGFNWESATCANNSGFQNISLESVNVLALRASNDGSDFALLELTQSPPINFGVYYAGWDKSGTNPTTQVAIHHPRGDLKKITFDTDAAQSATWGGAATWHILDWEDGTTEPGSSGSPLFDQNKRIIGQLYGGTANCGNNIDDYYGKFDVSWDNGSGPSDELISWLDACNTNVTFMDGYDDAIPVDDDVAISFENKPTLSNCGVNIPQNIRLTNNGTNLVTSVSFDYGLVGEIQQYTWTGNLVSGSSEVISLDRLYLCRGNYSYNLEITASNLANDQLNINDSDDFSFTVINGSDIQVVVQTNFEEEQTSFEIYTTGDELVFSENNFNDNELHTFNYCLPFGDYYFKMKDSGGDGLTPSFFVDPGYYSVSVDGVEFVNNDAFGSEEITNFHSEANGVLADFLLIDKMAGINFDIISNSSGNPQDFEWVAPNAVTPLGNNIIYNTSFANPGFYPVTLTVTNDTACDIKTKNIRIVKNTVGINNLYNNDLNVSVYPNPVDDILYISTTAYLNTTITLRNNIGQSILKTKLNNLTSTIDVSKYNKGIYFMTIENEKQKSIQKVVIR